MDDGLLSTSSQTGAYLLRRLDGVHQGAVPAGQVDGLVAGARSDGQDSPSADWAEHFGTRSHAVREPPPDHVGDRRHGAAVQLHLPVADPALLVRRVSLQLDRSPSCRRRGVHLLVQDEATSDIGDLSGEFSRRWPLSGRGQ